VSNGEKNVFLALTLKKLIIFGIEKDRYDSIE